MIAVQGTISIISLLFGIWVSQQIAKGRLKLRYSLLWLFMSLVVVFFSIYPEPIFQLSALLGFEKPSNFLLLCGVFFLLIICISLTAIVSKQDEKIKNLVQDLAILEARMKDAKNKEN